MHAVLQEILKSQAHLAAGLILLWSVIGVAAGLALGAVAALLLAKSGALRLQWKHAVWLRVLSCLWGAMPTLRCVCLGRSGFRS